VVIFSTTFLVLSRLLFGKALGYIRKREEEVSASHEAIRRDRTEVERLTREYQAHLAKVDKEAYDRTQEILKDALAQASALVGKAQADAQSQIERAQSEVAREKAEGLGRLRAEVARLAQSVAEKVLETSIDPSAAGAAVQKAVSERT